ncbi:SCO family protein [Oceanobacillus manasiensis]|uniref:SCO family protein n=1 Tax=Oceanobacillus manasiensis TaxID=586413 RepID=UPI0005A80EE3|nr:SCO family protein [Oceanobacillus manasiensis]
MKKTGKLLVVCLVIAGFFLVYWLWPNNDGLPILDEVNAFQLDDVHGEPFESTNGKAKLVAFFFTDCPDICPLTMVDLKELQTMLKEENLFGDKVELVSISLDPDNDTPEVITDYAANFQADTKGWKWLRGTPENTKQIAKEFQMQYEIEDDTVLYHSTTMYLLDEKSNIRALYDMAFSDKPVKKEDILEDIVLLTEE